MSEQTYDADATDATEPSAETTVDGPPRERSPATQDEAVQRLELILSKLDESHRLIDRQAEVSASLHAENQRLRVGELRKAQTPLVLNVLRVHDDIRRMAQSDDSGAAADLELAASALVDALERCGVEALTVEPGESFSPKLHRVVRLESTHQAELERTVAGMLRPGFVWADGELVRVAEVVVYRYAADAKEASVEGSAQPVDGTDPEPGPESTSDPIPNDAQANENHG